MFFVALSAKPIRAFLPVCASTASALPLGRRERTLVRPLAFGLASLYLHQTDKKSLLSPYFAIAPYGLLSPYFAIAPYGLLSPYFAIAPYGLLSRLFLYRSIRRFGSGYVLGLAPCAHTPTQLRYCPWQYAQPLAVLSTICPSVTIPHDCSSIDASETKDFSIVLASKILVCTKNYLFLLPYRALLCDNHHVVKIQIGCEEVW